jgi:hypothetical protein
MERSTVLLLHKRGKTLREIASELGRSKTTIARALSEAVYRQPSTRRRKSQVDVFHEQIIEWLQQGLSAVRMMELAREDPEHPYSGVRTPSTCHLAVSRPWPFNRPSAGRSLYRITQKSNRHPPIGGALHATILNNRIAE